MREKNFKNAYCYIYSFLLKKDTIIFENEKEKTLENYIDKFLNNINPNQNYYDNFFQHNIDRYAKLNLNNKLKINEIGFYDYNYLFKEYYAINDIFSYIENKSLFFYFDKNNQIILEKVYKLIKNICPFIKILHKKYSGNISEVFAKNKNLQVIIKQDNLSEKLEKFKKTFKDLFKEDISEEQSLINFLLTENKYKLIDKFKSIIDDYNEMSISSSNQSLNEQIDFFDVTIDDIIPHYTKKKK